ncbi:amino acid kinase family protein [Streptomyces sp. URMC 129]|uniref:amino acid kinase family protein n=1 Tax=Streptomyces sp. URMC 129 TaxID=3423407 RepID=UPI003F1DB871
MAGQQAPVVVKFGGSSFIELQDYRRVARHLSGLAHDEGRPVVAVVSGMSGSTGRLLEAARDVDPDLEPHVQDQVLATAEIVSAGLLRAALHAEGVGATDLWAPHIGVERTASGPVIAVDPRRLFDALADNTVVVVAGGQALDSDGRIVMLGRNSSDLTAVAVAAAVGADRCHIYSDVDGVYTADPHVVPGAHLMPELSYAQCAAMSSSGAKVLHAGAVRLAKAHAVDIVCASLTPDGAVTGSVIGAGQGMAAVVGDRRTQAFRFLGAWADDVIERVRASGAVGITAVYGDEMIVCFAGQQGNVAAALDRAGINARAVPGLRLVSVVQPDGRTEHTVVGVDSLDRAVHDLHTHIHGDATGTAPRVTSKRRSAHSGLLLGAGWAEA